MNQTKLIILGTTHEKPISIAPLEMEKCSMYNTDNIFPGKSELKFMKNGFKIEPFSFS